MPKKAAFGRITSLDPETQLKIDTLLMKNVSPAKVATIMIEEWGLYSPEEHTALAAQLGRYRTKCTDAKMGAVVARANKTKKGRLAIAEVEGQLDVMEDIKDLIQVQKRRINKMLKTEKNSEGEYQYGGKNLRMEMGTLLQLYKQYSYLQLETGVLARAAKTLTGQVQISDDGAMLEFEAQIEQNKDLRAISANIMNILEGEYEDITDQNAITGTGDS